MKWCESVAAIEIKRRYVSYYSSFILPPSSFHSLLPRHLHVTEPDRVSGRDTGAAEGSDNAEAGETAEKLGARLFIGQVEHLRHRLHATAMHNIRAVLLLHGDPRPRLWPQHRIRHGDRGNRRLIPQPHQVAPHALHKRIDPRSRGGGEGERLDAAPGQPRLQIRQSLLRFGDVDLVDRHDLRPLGERLAEEGDLTVDGVQVRDWIGGGAVQQMDEQTRPLDVAEK